MHVDAGKGNQSSTSRLAALYIPDNKGSFLGHIMPVDAGGLKETSLVPGDLPPLIYIADVNGSLLGRTMAVDAGGLRETSLVPADLPPFTYLKIKDPS